METHGATKTKLDPLLICLRDALKVGITREYAEKVLTRMAHRTARLEGWRPSELVATLARHREYLNRVYGRIT